MSLVISILTIVLYFGLLCGLLFFFVHYHKKQDEFNTQLMHNLEEYLTSINFKLVDIKEDLECKHK